MSHTPTPWEIYSPLENGVVVAPDGKEILAGKHAATIVRACNAHEELMEAVKGLVREAESMRQIIANHNFPTSFAQLEAILDGKAAIAKAEGK